MTDFDAKTKIITLENLAHIRDSFSRDFKDHSFVVTNGCFELLHPGHLSYLEEAANFGDFLVVGINSDKSIKEYKGRIRVPYTEQDRALCLAALECVHFVVIFDEPLATAFLKAARPDVYVKGGDYTPETLNVYEKAVLDGFGAEIKIIPFLQGYSTTEIIKKMTSSVDKRLCEHLKVSVVEGDLVCDRCGQITATLSEH